MPGISILLKYPKLLFLFNRDGENVSQNLVLRNCLRKYVQNGKTVLDFRKVSSKFSTCLGENDGKFISTWNLGDRNFWLLGAVSKFFPSQWVVLQSGYAV